MNKKIGIIALLLAGLVSLPLAAQPITNMDSQKKTEQASHFGKGKVVAMNREKLSIRLAHEPITTLGWPAMVMVFNVVNAFVLDGIRLDDTVQFELGKPRPSDTLWVIVNIERK